MRHQDIKNLEAFEIVAPAQIVAADAAVEQRPNHTQAVADMPKAAGFFIVAIYASLMAAFALTIHGGRVDFALVIGAFYLAMFFGVPAIMLAIEHDGSRRPDLGEFLERGIDTATGPISGAGALVQMLIVPGLLTLGVLAMGITYLLS
jgi:hypothetical protein